MTKVAKQTTVSSEGLKKLQEELEYLKTTKRKEVAEAIKVARGFGDLSENSEYDEAKNEQGLVEARIAEIESMLKNVKVIDESTIATDKVNVGNRVKVYDETFEEELEYTIVGSSEANPMEYKISDESPIGKALIGAEIGEVVKAETPGGDTVMKVLEISK
ncbi:MAG: transcription elongation factor GreA [Clostridia bacterium]|nr:transcription elongation factor GreA [Clostridia bacterium]